MRIHLAGVRPLELESVVGPLEDMRADALILLRQAPDDEGQYVRERIRERCGELGVEVDEVDVGVQDPAFVAHAITRVVDESPDDAYRFNLSTGPRTVAFGGFLAAQFRPIRLYHAVVDAERPSNDPGLSEHPYLRSVNVPAFHHEPPRDEVLDALEELLRLEGTASQAEWIDALVQRGVIRPKRKGVEELTPQAEQAQFRVLSDALEGYGFVERPAERRSRVFRVTPEGLMGLRLFRGRAEPPPLDAPQPRAPARPGSRRR